MPIRPALFIFFLAALCLTAIMALARPIDIRLLGAATSPHGRSLKNGSDVEARSAPLETTATIHATEVNEARGRRLNPRAVDTTDSPSSSEADFQVSRE